MTSHNTTKNVAVIGGGAMGSLLAGRLKLVQEVPTCSVWVLSNWKEHLASIQRNGLTLNSDGSHEVARVGATSSIEEIQHDFGDQGADYAFICVKGPEATHRAAVQAKNLLHPSGVAVTLQNGAGNYEILCREVGMSRVIVGVTTNGATIKSPGTVVHTGKGYLHVIEQDDIPGTGEQVSQTTQLSKMLCQAGLPTEVKPKSQRDSVIWKKLIINAGINPLTALLRVPNGFVNESKSCRHIVECVVDECLQVAAANNIVIKFEDFAESELDDDPHKQCVEAVLQAARVTSKNTSSMLSDVLRGNETEIDSINGAICQYGLHKGIETPINDVLRNLVRALHEKGTSKI